LANTIGQFLFNALCFGGLAVALGFAFVGPLPHFSVAALPFLFLSVALSLTINFFILALIGMAAFIFEDNHALYLIYTKFNWMLGLFLPVEFLPDWLQPVAKSLPFSYIHWAPAKLFVDFSPPLALEILPRQAMWAAAAVITALLCYRASVRRLQINGG